MGIISNIYIRRYGIIFLITVLCIGSSLLVIPGLCEVQELRLFSNLGFAIKQFSYENNGKVPTSFDELEQGGFSVKTLLQHYFPNDLSEVNNKNNHLQWRIIDNSKIINSHEPLLWRTNLFTFLWISGRPVILANGSVIWDVRGEYVDSWQRQ